MISFDYLGVGGTFFLLRAHLSRGQREAVSESVVIRQVRLVSALGLCQRRKSQKSLTCYKSWGSLRPEIEGVCFEGSGFVPTRIVCHKCPFVRGRSEDRDEWDQAKP